MLGRNFSTVGRIVLALSVLLLAADSVMAYIGPGVDVSLIGQFMALLWLAVAAASAVLMYPIYAILRRIRGRRGSPTPVPEPDKSAAPPLQTTPEETRVTSQPTDL
jgi:hypothetical protein